jgi:hypothetical protein
MTTDGVYQDSYGYFIRVRNGNIENLSGWNAPGGDYTEEWHGPLAPITDPLAQRMAAFLDASRP